jgi:hypothetical protein
MFLLAQLSRWIFVPDTRLCMLKALTYDIGLNIFDIDWSAKLKSLFVLGCYGLLRALCRPSDNKSDRNEVWSEGLARHDAGIWVAWRVTSEISSSAQAILPYTCSLWTEDWPGNSGR